MRFRPRSGRTKPSTAAADSDIMTHFSNPNYGLDALNSNLPTPSSAYDPATTTTTITTTTTMQQQDNNREASTAPRLDNAATTADINRQKQNDNESKKCGLGLSAKEVGVYRSSGTTGRDPGWDTGRDPGRDTERDTEWDKGRDAPNDGADEEDSDCYVEEEEEVDDDEEGDGYQEGAEPGDSQTGGESKEAGRGRVGGDRETTGLNKRSRNEPVDTTKSGSYEDDNITSNSQYGVYSPDSNDSGIQLDESKTRSTPSDIPTNDMRHDLKCSDGCSEKQLSTAQIVEVSPTLTEDRYIEVLASGWEKHEDTNGAYYWHIKSGTIQREPPLLDQAVIDELSRTKRIKSEQSQNKDSPDVSSCAVSNSCCSDVSGCGISNPAELDAQDDKDKDGPSSGENPACSAAGREFPLRFAVRSLGWVQMSEDELTAERSSKSVNKCIVGLSLGKNDLNDVVGRWGDGKSLYLELDEESLSLIDPQDMTVLNVQSIQSIRVWGVGRSNGRDFAYVARDHVTRKHMCHVFRCDGLACHIAGALRDICKRILAERNAKETALGTEDDTTGRDTMSANPSLHRMGMTGINGGITRPNNLPNLGRVGDPPDGQHLTFESLYKNTSFPTPMEEPKKMLKCHYLGTTQVSRPTGVETLNDAMDKVYLSQPPTKWVYVVVAIAPSTITISEHGKPENIFAECRVRFLSFMGIAMNNSRLCAFIMHGAHDQFIAHVFHCDPSASSLCKTIEAACKLRYQKCLDAHHRQQPLAGSTVRRPLHQGLGSSIRLGVQTVLGNLTKGCKPKS